MELFEQIRREYDFGAGTIKGVARKLGVRLAVGARGVGQRGPEGSKNHYSTATEIGAGDSLHRCDSAGRSNRTPKTAAYRPSDLVPDWSGDAGRGALGVDVTGSTFGSGKLHGG